MLLDKLDLPLCKPDQFGAMVLLALIVSVCVWADRRSTSLASDARAAAIDLYASSINPQGPLPDDPAMRREYYRYQIAYNDLERLKADVEGPLFKLGVIALVGFGLCVNSWRLRERKRDKPATSTPPDSFNGPVSVRFLSNPTPQPARVRSSQTSRN